MKRLYVVSAAAIPVLSAGFLGGISAPTQADPIPVQCSHYFADRDDTSGTVDAPRAKLRSGPAYNCSAVHGVPEGTELDYDCYVIGADGQKWTHAQYDDYEAQGWIAERSLTDEGSDELC